MILNNDYCSRSVASRFVLGATIGVALLAQGCSSSTPAFVDDATGNTSEPAEIMTTEMMTSEMQNSEMTGANMPRNCGSDHPAVGQEAELSTVAHNVSGTVRVIDNCTLQISNFNYDGRGPSVYFWGAVNRDYTGPDYFQIGERINGTAYENETVIIDIPEDKTLDDFDSLSVWCLLVGANFGDAMWNSNP